MSNTWPAGGYWLIANDQQRHCNARPVALTDVRGLQVIQGMRSTITARGQTVVPAPIRKRFGLGPSTRLEWIVDGDGAIRVVPVALDPIAAFRGSGGGGGTARLLKDRALDRQKEER